MSSSQRQSNTGHDAAAPAVATLLIALLLYLAFVAGRTALADLYSARAIRVLGQWSASREPPSREQWEAVQGVMLDALDLDPHNPRILDGLGRVHRWGAATPDRPREERRALREEALVYFRKSLEQRTTDPFAWANLALEKYALGQFDVEFEHAIQMATFFGPWIPRSQLGVAAVGLGAWDSLSDRTRSVVREAVTRGLTWPAIDPTRAGHSERVWRIARHHERNGLVCGWGLESARVAEWCQD